MYCAKSVEGETIYCARPCLLYNIKELVESYNDEHSDSDKITFYHMHEVIGPEKQILFQIENVRMIAVVKLVRMVSSFWTPYHFV